MKLHWCVPLALEIHVYAEWMDCMSSAFSMDVYSTLNIIALTAKGLSSNHICVCVCADVF